MPPDLQSDNVLPESTGSAVASDIVVLGKIVGPYGLHGAVRVHPFADDPKAWARLQYWWIGREGSPARFWQKTRVIKCNIQGDTLIANLECLPDRNASEAVHGVLVGVPRAELPPASHGEYYWADLIGLDVFNTRDELLGQILGLIDTPANAVLRVGDGLKPEQLLPFVAAVVVDVDLAARKVCVDWESDW